MEKEDKRLFRIRNVHIKEDPEHKILFNDSLTLAQRPITPYSRKNPDKRISPSKADLEITKLGSEDIRESMERTDMFDNITLYEIGNYLTQTLMTYKYTKANIPEIHKITQTNYSRLKNPKLHVHHRIISLFLRFLEDNLYQEGESDMHIFPLALTNKISSIRYEYDEDLESLYQLFVEYIPFEYILKKKYLIFPRCLHSKYFLIIMFPEVNSEMNYGDTPCMIVFDPLERDLQATCLSIRKILDLGFQYHYHNLCNQNFHNTFSLWEGIKTKTMIDYIPELPNSLRNENLDSGLIMVKILEKFLEDPENIIASQILGFSKTNEEWVKEEDLNEKREDIEKIIKNLLSTRNIKNNLDMVMNDSMSEYLSKPDYNQQPFLPPISTLSLVDQD